MGRILTMPRSSIKFTLSELDPTTSWKISKVDGANYLDDVTEQINVLAGALEEIREAIGKDAASTSTTSALSSVWGSSSKQQTDSEPTLSLLPPKQHPILLQLWADSITDSSFMKLIVQRLRGLIDERREFLSDIDKSKAQRPRKRRKVDDDSDDDDEK